MDFIFQIYLNPSSELCLNVKHYKSFFMDGSVQSPEKRTGDSNYSQVSGPTAQPQHIT